MSFVVYEIIKKTKTKKKGSGKKNLAIRVRGKGILFSYLVDETVGCRRRCGRIGASAFADVLVCRFVLLIELLDGLNLLFELHAPILEPDFNLALRQAEAMRHLDPSSPRQVVIRMELLFQFERLVARVRLASTTSKSVGT